MGSCYTFKTCSSCITAAQRIYKNSLVSENHKQKTIKMIKEIAFVDCRVNLRDFVTNLGR